VCVQDVGCSYAGQGPGAVSGEDNTEPLGFVKCRKYFEKVNNQQSLKKDSGPRS